MTRHLCLSLLLVGSLGCRNDNSPDANYAEFATRTRDTWAEKGQAHEAKVNALIDIQKQLRAIPVAEERSLSDATTHDMGVIGTYPPDKVLILTDKSLEAWANGQPDPGWVTVSWPIPPLNFDKAFQAMEIKAACSGTDDEACANAGKSTLGITTLEPVQYAVVVRATTQLATTVHVESVDGFVSGAVDGDAVVFSVPDGKLVGAFPLAVRNSDSVRVVGTESGELNRDLSENLKKAVLDGLRAP